MFKRSIQGFHVAYVSSREAITIKLFAIARHELTAQALNISTLNSKKVFFFRSLSFRILLPVCHRKIFHLFALILFRVKYHFQIWGHIGYRLRQS